MSGRDAQTGKPASVGGNRKRIAFHDFENGYILEDDLYSQLNWPIVLIIQIFLS